MSEMGPRPTVVLGILGTSMDRGGRKGRWERWRPTVDLCRQDDLVVARLELLYGPGSEALLLEVMQDLEQVSPETEVCPRPIDLGDPWDFERVFATLHDFALGYPFDPEAEDYLVHVTTGSHVAQICLFLLTESRHLPGRLVQTVPPRGEKGTPGGHQIIDLDLSRFDRIARRFEAEHEAGSSFLKAGIETRNPAFNALIDRLERVCLRSLAPILLVGPTGAGKTRLARRIHELARARNLLSGPLVEVNCATLRGDQAQSALFGHVRGAFTGAERERAGLLRAADGGTLFLDEIGELGLDEQAMLLRAIEDRRFLPVGSDREVGSAFRLIAGTNRALGERVRSGHFREDLLARIDLWTFELPGLRARPEDLAPNLDYQLAEHERRTGRRVRFGGEARRRFERFAGGPDALWTRNFRDLDAAVTRMATLADGGRVSVEAVDAEIERLRASWDRGGAAPEDRPRARVEAVLGAAAAELDLFDRAQLEAVLEVCARSRSLSEAGRQLFAVSRARKASANDADRLRKYLARFGLRWDRLAESTS